MQSRKSGNPSLLFDLDRTLHIEDLGIFENK